MSFAVPLAHDAYAVKLTTFLATADRRDFLADLSADADEARRARAQAARTRAWVAAQVALAEGPEVASSPSAPAG